MQEEWNTADYIEVGLKTLMFVVFSPIIVPFFIVGGVAYVIGRLAQKLGAPKPTDDEGGWG